MRFILVVMAEFHAFAGLNDFASLCVFGDVY